MTGMLCTFDGGRLFGERFGSGPPEVLALHGWRRDRADWRQVLADLDAVAVDLPGFGASPPPDRAWSARDYANALTPVLDQMRDRIVVIGHSFGGTVALCLAAQHPDRVAGLVLTGTPRLVTTASTNAAAPPLRYRIARWLHRRHLLSDARMERLRQARGSDDYNAADGVLRDIFVRAVNDRFDAETDAVRCPVELVWGDDDTAAPLAGAQAAAARLHDARLTVLAGAGHMTPLTRPAELRAAVDRVI